MIRVVLPVHLRRLAQVGDEVPLAVAAPVTIHAVLDGLEAAYPMLRGTIRDPRSRERRDFVRFFVCQEDWSHEPRERELPAEVVRGAEPLLVIGAMAGG